MQDKPLPVHEMFYTWQGEGVHMGRPAFFVRLFGCPVHCPWCDSAGTWHPDYVPKDIQRLSPVDIWEQAEKTPADFIVLTGGEPAIHDLEEFCIVAERPVHIETSGAFELRNALIDWVTVSPKRWKLPLAPVVRRANEFKFIIERPDDISFYLETIVSLGYSSIRSGTRIPIWLHPEWSQRENADVLRAISHTVKIADFPFRAGWQLHKLYNVDALDKRSRPLVPLGGDVSRGY